MYNNNENCSYFVSDILIYLGKKLKIVSLSPQNLGVQRRPFFVLWASQQHTYIPQQFQKPHLPTPVQLSIFDTFSNPPCYRRTSLSLQKVYLVCVNVTHNYNAKCCLQKQPAKLRVYPEGYTIFCRDYWRNL